MDIISPMDHSKADDTGSKLSTDSFEHRSEEVENIERELIQSIRTTGLKKERENYLVDKVISLRKERRQLFCMLLKELKIKGTAADSIKNKLNEAKIFYHEQLNKNKKELEEKSELHIRQLNLAKEEEKMQSSQLSMITKRTIDKLQEKYETKLRAMEEKIRLIINEKNTTDDMKIQAAVERHSKNLKIEYESQMRGYKDTISSLLHKNKILENEMQIEKSNFIDVKQRLIAIQNSSELISTREKKLEVENCELMTNLGIKIKEIELLKKKNHDTEKAYRHKISSINKEYTEKMNKADDKIRKTLEGKDTIIQKLKSENSSLKKLLATTEQTMLDLNKELIK